MRKNTLKKAMAVMISATMLVTGYTVVSAEGFTDAEALAEMDAFTTGDEAVYVEEVQPEAAQTEEVQPEQTQTEVQPNIINLRLDITHLYYPAKNSFQKSRLKRREIFTELLLYTLTTKKCP